MYSKSASTNQCSRPIKLNTLLANQISFSLSLIQKRKIDLIIIKWTVWWEDQEKDKKVEEASEEDKEEDENDINSNEDN